MSCFSRMVGPARRRRRSAWPVALPLVWLAATGWAAASVQAGPAGAESPAETAPAERTAVDAYDPRTPVGAVRGFIDACRAGRYERAAEHLDLSAVEGQEPPVDPALLAWRLKVVLDRKLWINYASLSADPQGFESDGLPSDVDRVGTIGEDRFEVLLRRGDDGRWRFSAHTVEAIPTLYDRYGYGRLGEWLPAAMFEIQALDVQLWQWIGLLLALLVAGLAGALATALLRAVVRPMAARTRTTFDDQLLDRIGAPLRAMLTLVFFVVATYPLLLVAPVYVFLGTLEKAAALLITVWGALRVVDVLSSVVDGALRDTERAAALALLPMGRRVVKVVILAIGALGALQQFGVNVTGLVAGLGVGGLAVALAAQKTLANLFGGVTLLTDQPVRVGQFCRYGDNKLGTVEEIGLRSTRLRTLDRTLVTVPNAEFSEFQLENFAVRDRIRWTTVLGLRYETSADQLRFVLVELRKLLVSHPKVLDDPARVRFIGFGSHSLDVEIFSYIATSDWAEFLAIREDLMLRVMELIESSGTGFAFPSQTLYLGRDGGLDPEATERSVRSLRELREAGRMPLPDLDPQALAEMRGTADYPPRGSVAAAAAES